MSTETKPNCPLETGMRPCQCEMSRCPVCNYTAHDARFELDHGRCPGKIPCQCDACLPCGSCGEPQPIGIAICSECGLPPAWIVEPCDFCHGSPANVSAPEGWSDFAADGCPKCDSGWVATTHAAERSATWQTWAETLTGDASEPLELFEVGDGLPDPADEYARREALLRTRLRFRVAYRAVATGMVGIGRTEMSREVARRMIERENERDPRFVRWIVPTDSRAVRVYDQKQADLVTGLPLLDHRGEFVGREIERSILFEDEEGAADLWEAREIERGVTAERLARAEALLGEAVRMIDAGINPANAPDWLDLARFASRPAHRQRTGHAHGTTTARQASCDVCMHLRSFERDFDESIRAHELESLEADGCREEAAL